MYLRLFFLFFLISLTSFAQQESKVEFQISSDENLKESWKENGRLVVYLSKNAERPPLFQGTFSSDRVGFARNIEKWEITNSVILNVNNSYSASEFSMYSIPHGKWYIQAVYSISEIPDLRAAGNFYTEVQEVDIHENQSIKLNLTKTIGKRRNSDPVDSEMVKYITLESKLLSDFWDKPMQIKASVLLPPNFDKTIGKKYPVRVNIGGYGSSWTRASRLEKNKEYMTWWNSEEAPEFIQIFPHGDGPFGDPYYINSENSGPYGSALIEELIPYIEKEFNAIGKPEFRFVDGCSTGGWVSFALQVFYPDFFNGAWSFSADPVDFNHMQLVNMYEDKNAFYNKHGYLTPSVRSTIGQPRLSIKDEVAGENLTSFENTYTTAGGQWGGWNALYSPRGEDGNPIAAFHAETGEIDSIAVQHWKSYDLLKIVQNNWDELGPKLQGKLWVWMGDMDEFYLNNAMREMDKFLKSTTNPKSDAQINFEPTKGHCDEFDHRLVLEMMHEKIQNGK